MPHSSCLRSVKHASRQRGPRSAIRVQPRRRCPSPSRRLHAPPAGCKLVPDSPVAAARSLSWRCDCDCGCHHSDSCWHRLSTALSAIVPTSLPALNDPHLYMHYTHIYCRHSYRHYCLNRRYSQKAKWFIQARLLSKGLSQCVCRRSPLDSVGIIS